MKKPLALFMASMIVMGGTISASAGDSAALSDSRFSYKSYSQPEDLGAMIQTVSTLDSAYGIENGVQVLYATSSGTPAVFNVIDIVQNKLLRSFSLPGIGASWTHTVDNAGNVYIGGSGRMFRYSPQTKFVTDLGIVAPGAREVYGLSTDEAGNVYGGVYPGAKVFQYNPATGTFRDYGNVQPGQDYVRSLAYANGNIYAGIGTVGALIQVDPVTGALTNIPFPERPEYTTDSLGFVYDLNVVGSYLFVPVTGQECLFIYDLSAKQWLPILITNYKGLYTSPEMNGKTYFVADNKVKSFDLVTHDIVDTGIAYGTFFRKTGWIELPNDPDFPGKSLATVQFGGQTFVMNFTTGKTRTLPAVAEGQPIGIQALEKGSDNKLYVSGYMGTQGAQYDPSAGTKTVFNLGQAEGMASSGNHMYFGVYSGATVYDLDMTKPPQANVNPKLLYDIQDGQDRPFAMTVADNKLIAGTIPTYGELGGAVTVIPLDGSGQPRVYRNVVQDQSIIGVAYKDGKIYGSTSVWGGLGIAPSQTEAKLFVMDAATGQKLTEFAPQLPNAVKAKAIGGLSFGPDNLLWGAAYGTIFAVNPNTLQVVKSKEIVATDWNFGHLWRPVYLRWSSDGLLYTTLGGQMIVVDPATLEHKALGSSSIMTLGHDGHIYFAEGSQLKRIKVADAVPEQRWEIEMPVLNPGFEQPADGTAIPGWQPFFANSSDRVNYAVTGERKFSGDSSVRLIDTASNEGVALISSPIAVRPGVEYTASTKLYIESGRTSFLLRYYDASGKQVGESVAHIQTGQGNWQHVTAKLVAPNQAVTARILLSCSSLWVTKAYYDDVRLTYSSTVAPPVVVHPTAAFATNDNTPTITVRSASGTSIIVEYGSEVIGTGAGAGNVPVEVELSALPEGVYDRLTVRAEDARGNSSLPVSLPSITIDLTAPAAPTVISPAIPESSPSRIRTVEIAAEAGAVIQVMEGETITGSGIGLGDNPTAIVLDLPEIGVHKLTAIAVDAAGNASAPAHLPHLIVNNGNGSGNR